MHIKSFGYRTDIMLRLLEGGERADHGDYIVVRSPANPSYWWVGSRIHPPTAVSWKAGLPRSAS